MEASYGIASYERITLKACEYHYSASADALRAVWKLNARNPIVDWLVFRLC